MEETLNQVQDTITRAPIDEDQEHEDQQRALVERLSREFLKAIPKTFRYAARELEYQKVFEIHARLAYTSLGKRALVRELIPGTDVIKMDTSLKEVAEQRLFIASNEYPPFSGMDDIAPTIHKSEIIGSTIYVEEGAKVLRALQAMRALREYYARRTKEVPQLWRTAVHLFDDRILEMHFNSVFDESGNVKDSASAELRRIRREIIETADRLRTRLSSVLRKLTEDEYVQEELITQRDGRFVIPVKVEHKRRVPGLIHSVSQTGQTVFVEPSETLELNNELRSLEFAEQREIERILRELAAQLREAAPQLLRSLEAAAHLEAICAKARYAHEIGGQELRVEQQNAKKSRKLLLKDARHPLLLQKLGKAKTVALTIELDETRRTLVLTGPNAGGKTVLLKTLGILTFMAQSGIPVPAEADGVLPLMDGVYVEIGDSQSLADDLSTFSSHISSLSRILSDATRESLILLDEIGGGTAPEEGGAIAESILEYVTRMGAFIVATTHYGRLAAFAEAVRGAVNGSMEFNRETLTPTFRFRLGVPGSSHAFDIAQRYGLPKSIVQRGRELRGEESSRLEDLVRSLEELQHEARERKAESERELGKARVLKVEFERKRDEVEDIRRTAKRAATQEAEEILKRANSFVERAVREAREAAHQEAAAQSSTAATRPAQATEALKALRARQENERQSILKDVEKLDRSLTPPPPAGETLVLAVGAKVRLKSNPTQTGEVSSIRGKDVEVQMGALRVRVKPDQIEVISNAEAKSQAKSAKREISQATQYLSGHAETRIDLRGLYGDEGIMEVEKFLADASAHGLERVEIIHGIGTGALGRKIGQHLKGHSLVASYRYGEPQEGGAGVTIVELK